MSWMRLILSWILALFTFQNTFGESAIPFTDIKTTDPYYSSVLQLYRQWIISDNAEHLFYPDEKIMRDMFVWIVVGVSCHRCINPSVEDYIKYQINPFLDVTKINHYFYCISYAKEKDIVEWYNFDPTTNISSCQNGVNYNSTDSNWEVPFCPMNNIVRAEAVAVLLRQAGMWTEQQNTELQKNIVFSGKWKAWDMSFVKYWFGYVKKAIDAGLISEWYRNLFIDTTIDINELESIYTLAAEQIKRSEFANMAAKMLTLNQCNNIDTGKSDFWVEILLFDKDSSNSENGIGTSPTLDGSEDTFDLYAELLSNITRSDVDYKWDFLNLQTKETSSKNGKWLNNHTFPSAGVWMITLTATDKKTWEVTTAIAQVYIKKWSNDTGLSSYITAIAKPVWIPTLFDSTVEWWIPPYSYLWDFWDGGSSIDADPSHVYTKPWVYPVTLTVKDSVGNISINKIVVEVKENCDPDGDTVLSCPSTKNNSLTNKPAADIIIKDKTPANCGWETPLTFDDNTYDFYAKTNDTSPNMSYHWLFVNQNTWEKLVRTWKCLDNLTLNPGTWNITLTVIDNDSGESSIASSQLTIPWATTQNPSINTLTVAINADPIYGIDQLTTNFNGFADGWAGWYTYEWKFWDSATSTTEDPTHTYTNVGSYTVTLTVKDKDGNTATATVVVQVDPSKTIEVLDLCPEIFGPVENKGCPYIPTWNHYTDTITEIGSYNICMKRAVLNENIIVWNTTCTSCPCDFRIEFQSIFRVCDILFPTILSPDKQSLYSRWNIYQVN